MIQRGQVPLTFERFDQEQMLEKSDLFYKTMDRRRSVRDFSDEDVPRHLIERAILTANTSPSGAHKQPWTFVAVSNPTVKREIRIAAEKEEKESYDNRMSKEWLEALAPLGTNWQKPFLERVPWIVVCFSQAYGLNKDGKKEKHYYVQESCGIACGFFIAALHNMGLCTLTHTPSPMRFLNSILKRPSNEKPFILFPVGYPQAGATVPKIKRKELLECSVWV